ncbi:unnamed protein product [Strongylus vulgaris]|uniref:PDZ domain-containing protein n=1 Tax=Strongylus vulgaris TaxID=40348 RepID=A0A3P7INV2_STRVU|nr:unnamed protein product [Strongylus vulgaris]
MSKHNTNILSALIESLRALRPHQVVRSVKRNSNDGDNVEPSSVCHRAGLQVGHRLIEVNGDSLLGCDQSEAATILRSSNELRILVCDGYNKPSMPRIDDRTITSSTSSSSNVLVDENKLVSTSSISTVANTSVQNGDHHQEPSRFDEPPLASSSPLPTTPLVPPSKPGRIPPAVAPKPTLRNSQVGHDFHF